MDLKTCLKEAIKRHASDFHVVVGTPATFRVNGELVMMQGDVISRQEAKDAIYELLSEDQRQTLEKQWELNFAFSLPDVGRFRVNVYMQRGNIEAAFRVISIKPRTLKELGLPPVVAELSRRPSGLILVTGPAGQGKTTTLAAMINLINRDERRYRIVTIEDPIEYLHESVNSVIIQREVGIDTKSFNTALVQSLRQDPNIICVGEMRDLETIATALTASETGHLVLATLHAPDAIQAVERVVDVFPPHQQQQIRIEFSSSIEGIISQRLLPRADGKGRVLAIEILMGNLAVRTTIRDNRLHQLASYLAPPMDRSLKELYQAGLITYDAAISHARDPKSFGPL